MLDLHTSCIPRPLIVRFNSAAVLLSTGWATFHELSVPTNLEELQDGPTKGRSTIQTDASAFSRGSVAGDVVRVSAGTAVMNVRGLRMTLLGDNDESLNDNPQAAVE